MSVQPTERDGPQTRRRGSPRSAPNSAAGDMPKLDECAEGKAMIEDSTPADAVAVTASSGPALVMMPAKYFLFGSAIVASGLLAVGHFVALPTSLLAVEVFATIFGLFVFGSFKYQVHKNALTYGMLLIMVGTFTQLATSTWHAEIAERGWAAWTGHHLLSFKGLDELV